MEGGEILVAIRPFADAAVGRGGRVEELCGGGSRPGAGVLAAGLAGGWREGGEVGGGTSDGEVFVDGCDHAAKEVGEGAEVV